MQDLAIRMYFLLVSLWSWSSSKPCVVLIIFGSSYFWLLFTEFVAVEGTMTLDMCS